ncbi:MAG: leucine-rich repeat domain-containing protein [Oscillospiraceae bacterium]|nr:leucine-rich repeat domain-containing protein [Oscillospiraceae bacterium]
MAFEIENGVLKKYIPEDGETAVIIPDSVISIESYAFNKCSELEEVTIPDSVTSIGAYAFSNTKWLEEYPNDWVIINTILIKYKGEDEKVTIPNTVKSIGESAFSHCESLKEVIISDSVMSIGKNVFADCLNLEKIKVSEENTIYSDIDGVLFNKEKTELLCYSQGKKENSYKIPDRVTGIGEQAFSWCKKLKGVIIPDSVISIGKGAFYECSSLNKVIIPDSVTSIGNSAFEECSSLNELKMPNYATNIGDFTFYNCSDLGKVTISDSIIGIGEGAFEHCSSLTSIIIPASVMSIGDWAFYECSSLEKVTIKSVTFNVDYKKFDEYISEAYKMLETKDFSAKIYTPLKNAMIIGHFIKTGDECAEAFIKKGCLRIFKWLIDEEDVPTIYALINTHKFVTAKNIDKLFDYANQKNNAELKLIFMNYKHEHIGMTKKKELKI